MAQTLEQYVAEATNAYRPAQTAIQSQIDALSGNLKTGEDKINSQYALQEEGLNRQRNQAAEDASLAAAARGSAFGGQAELANQKYYERTFTPALTTLQANKSNDLAQLRQDIDNQRTSLNSQLANLEATANQQALQQYWAELEAEKQRQAQAQANSAQNACYQYLADAIKNQGQSAQSQKANTSFIDWINNYSGWDNNKKNTWSTALNAVNSGNNALSMSFFGNSIANNIANNLPNTAEYKDYLRWRNS